MSNVRPLRPVDEHPSGMSTAEAIAAYLQWLGGHRGRSGRLTSPQTLRAYTSALPRAFAGYDTLAELAEDSGHRLRTNLRTAWGDKSPATWNARRAAVQSALNYFREQGWLPDDLNALGGVGREPEPAPPYRVRDRSAIDRLINSKRLPLRDRTLYSLLYSSAARCEEVLSLNIEDLDRANRRARTIRKGGDPGWLLYDTRTARLLGQYLGKRTRGPLFLSDRKPGDGTVPQRDIDPASGRRRISYATVARRLSDATGGWTPHDLRHSRLTHAGEDGATEADLMNLSGHKDRRTLQRYLRPSLESTHRRLDEIDARRGAWTPDADEIAAKLTDASAQEPMA